MNSEILSIKKMPDMLTPFVYWAQTEHDVTLKVDLTDVKDPEVNLEPGQLRFVAHGQGARGPNQYGFLLNFFTSVNVKDSSYRIVDRQVDFLLRKQTSGWWTRLTAAPTKPPWLKIDFDKWKSEDMDDDDEKRDIRQDYPDMYDKLHKEEMGYKKEDFKKVYLILYNLCQFVGFLYILTIMGIRYSREGPDSMSETYASVGNAMKFIQLLQFMEVMHPMFGYTKANAFVAFLQVSGRGFVLFCMVEAEPRMQTKPVIFYVFLVWSLVEVFRYPYYLTQLLKVEIPILTWLRYTIWMPLYPLGFLCEGIIVLRNIPYFEETEKFTVELPNSWNFAFHMPTFMRLYLLLLSIPGMYTMMSHMNRTRMKKLGRSNIERKYA